jgi:hypothetical protein
MRQMISEGKKEFEAYEQHFASVFLSKENNNTSI